MADPAEFAPNHIMLDFADGEYRFRLPLAQLAELQTKCDAGVGLIFQRLMKGRYPDGQQIIFNPLEAIFRYQDITETIRLGLIGGGMGIVDGKEIKVDPAKALQLMRNYVEPRPLLDNWSIAAAIAVACMIGYVDPKAEKKKSLAGAGTVDDLGKRNGEGWFAYDIALANCAMMGVSISDARDLTLWEYEALLTQWNLRHDPDGDLDVVTTDDWQRTQDFFARNPQLMN